MIHIAIVADFDSKNITHPATRNALKHAACQDDVELGIEWLATDWLADHVVADELSRFDGLFIGPGSPYRSKNAAIEAIRFARERRVPLIGACGGFQHVVIEFARNVLAFPDAEHAEYDPYASRLFVTRLPCSLVGKELPIELAQDSMAGKAYGTDRVTENYYCNFGLNHAYTAMLESAGLVPTGLEAGEEETRGAVRIFELSTHPFFVATLFVPQMRSTSDAPHPLLRAFIRAATASRR
jgi:CTP synthase (UTP-ammonia lyase)